MKRSKLLIWLISSVALGCGDGKKPPQDATASEDLAVSVDSDTAVETTSSLDTTLPSPSSVSLVHMGSTEMEKGTHRPEIFATDDGGLLLAVVHPDGPPQTEGSIKHKAYHLNTDLEVQGEGFSLTTYTDAYGDPADHRVLLVGDEVVVVYQTLLMDPAAEPPHSGPAEQYALNQSLMLARMKHDGTEVFRGPIVAHATDFEEDNFPDHCMTYDGSSLIVSTGSNDSAKVRVVDLDGTVTGTYSVPMDPDTIGTNIGNSLFWKDEVLHIASGASTKPSDPKPLVFATFDADFSVAQVSSYLPEGEDAIFPTGIFTHQGVVFVAYSAHAAGSSPDIEVNPYEPRLAAFDEDWNVLLDMKVSADAGAGHVHPTLTIIDDVIYYAWSRKSTSDNPAPQVYIERYQLIVE